MYWFGKPQEPEGTIKFVENPIESGRVFGFYKDPDGNEWDLGGCISGCILARLINDFDSYGCVKTWKPYKIEVVGEKIKE
jgi:hypothetical protein